MTEIDFIKACLEYLKLLLTSSIGAVFLLALYQIQNPERITVIINIGYWFFILLFSIFSVFYGHFSNKLKAVD